MKVSEVFNDFYSLLTGKKFLGLNRLMEKYREEPLFWVMLSNLSETEELSLLDAMQEAYGLYKEFAEEKAGAGVRMEQLYDRAIKYGQKWDKPVVLAAGRCISGNIGSGYCPGRKNRERRHKMDQGRLIHAAKLNPDEQRCLEMVCTIWKRQKILQRGVRRYRRLESRTAFFRPAEVV